MIVDFLLWMQRSDSAIIRGTSTDTISISPFMAPPARPGHQAYLCMPESDAPTLPRFS